MSVSRDCLRTVDIGEKNLLETVATVVTSNVHIAKSSDLESNLFNKSWIQFLFSQLHMTVLNQNQRPE